MTRSMLFVPAGSTAKFEKALASEADAIILDLEDSIALKEKPAARDNLVRLLQAHSHAHKDIWVRVNALESGLILDDLAAIAPLPTFGIVLPKCDGAATLRQVAHYLDAFDASARKPANHSRILAIATETASSIFGLGTYAGVTPRLWGITWGGEDLAGDLGSLSNRVGGTYTQPYQLARSLCLFAAAHAKVAAIDAVCVDLDDDESLRTEAEEGFRDGFVGKMAIHPKHLAAINRGYRANREQQAWAHKVIAAFNDNPDAGALRMDGKMIDAPHWRLAQRLAERNT